MVPTLRVARPSDDLEALLGFYRDGLGLEVLDRFEDHDGFDGVMLGQVGAPYHFEFTRARGHAAGRAPTEDNLLVFYLPDAEVWRAAVTRMRAAGYRSGAGVQPLLGPLGRDVRGSRRLSGGASARRLGFLSAAARKRWLLAAVRPRGSRRA